MKYQLLAVALVGGAAAVFYSVYVGAGIQPQAPESAPVPVAIAKVAKQDVPIELDGLGRVQAFNMVTVRTQVEGQIQNIAYQQGHDVNKGDLLVKIDPRIFQAKLEQDQAALARDKAHLENAMDNLHRFQPLAKSGFATGQQVDTQQAMVAQLQATLKSDQAVIDQDQVELGYTDVTAPISGVAGLRLVDEGNVVHPTDATGLVTIAQIQPIAVLFTLPQAVLSEIQTRMIAAGTASLAVEAFTQDGNTLLDKGTLETLDNKIDPASGTITLRADFPNAERRLWPGEFVQARLILSVQHDGLTVPGSVVQRGSQGTFAWVVQPDGTAAAVPIQVVQLAHGTALVASGLTEGMEVVTDGQYGLKDGSRVVESHDPSEPLKNAQTDMLGIQP
ncbi:MAG TPA: efflux RND transporter periplasmic adaptor subunit [Aliidongia sp.]|nr:efflux RND transporter periplasmic adaptor subunit [Aliidongia sp.]